MNAMKNEKLIKLPVLFDAGGDISKKWYVLFYCRNPKTNKFERQRMMQGINSIHTVKGRYAAGEKMVNHWREKLLSGWSPLTDQNIIYDDNLQFQSFIKHYRVVKSHNGTFRFFASKFMDFIKNNIEDSTQSTYRSKLRMFDGWLETNDMNAVDIAAITQSVMVKFFTFIIEERKLSHTSVKKYRQILSQVFNFVKKEKDRKLFINPCFDLPDTKRVNDNTPQPIQEYDIEKFKELIGKEDPQLWLAISFEYYCFIRPGKELRLLRIGDIDFGRGVVRVNPVNAKTVERVIGIPSVFLNILRNEYKLHTYDRKLYVFGNKGIPGPMHYGKNNLRYRFSKYRKKMDMPEMYKLYSWKHTGNVRAVKSGITLYDLQKHNGHSSIETTEGYLKNLISISSADITSSFPEI